MVIGLAGGTCSGKTSVAQALAQQLDFGSISLDSYFKEQATFPVVFGHADYDRLEAIDWTKMIHDIERTPGNVIVEGFLVLAPEELRKKFDISFFIDMDENALLSRRLQKEPQVAKGYIATVRKRHRSLVLPTKQYADVILDGHLTIIGLVKEIKKHLFHKLVAEGLTTS